MSTINDKSKKVAVRVTKTKESPYLIRKNARVPEFSVVSPKKSKYIKPVDMAILSMIPQGDPGLTVYLHEFFRKNKSEQQNNTLWFPIAEDPGKPENHTPIQTRIPKKINELKLKKLNPQENSEF